MNVNTFYPLTGTMILIGSSAILYGIQSECFLIFLEGVFLFWLGLRLTFSALEAQRLEVA